MIHYNYVTRYIMIHDYVTRYIMTHYNYVTVDIAATYSHGNIYSRSTVKVGKKLAMHVFDI